MHIYDFILDEHQYTLKNASRGVTKGEAFENAFDAYIQLFLQSFDTIDCSTSPKNLSKKLAGDKSVIGWFEKYCGIIKRDRQQIEALMKDIFEVYIVFISGKHQTAVGLLYHILEKYDLLDNVWPEQLGGTFRVRDINKNPDYLKDEFYQHLPYNLRYLVGNQRFSVTGIPLHYGGASMMAAFFELGSGLNEKKLGTAMFAFDSLAHLGIMKDFERVKPRKHIFDISNFLFEMVNDIFYEFIEKGKPISDSIFYSITPQTFVRQFRKFVLSSLCTFPKQRNTSFVEEYIIPQLLTEAIRQHKYNGIIFPSTKFIDKKVVVNSDWQSNFYKNNIVLFTDYNPKTNHDEILYENFKSKVLDLKDIGKFDANAEVPKIETAIGETEAFLGSLPKSEILYGFIDILRNFKKRIRIYPHIVVDGMNYLDTFAGKAEIKYLISYYKFVSSQIFRIYETEIDKYEANKAAKNSTKKN